MYTRVLELKQRIESLVNAPEGKSPREDARQAVAGVLAALDKGLVRAASRSNHGTWVVHAWVRQAILLGFRIGTLSDYSTDRFPFFDKDTYPPKSFEAADRVRIVPGGSAIRTGSYLASGVVCMPPMYVNVGAYVDEGTLIDSHALVGSCAQIGKRVHLSAAVQIGGVLEPVGAIPVIIEDDVFLGGGSGVYEGCLIRSGAVLAPGVTLTGSTRLFDLVHGRTIERNSEGVLEVPENAVIVPGSRPAKGAFARQRGLTLYAPVIVKYRDGKTDAATALEESLR